jgi:hypothetical protein
MESDTAENANVNNVENWPLLGEICVRRGSARHRVHDGFRAEPAVGTNNDHLGGQSMIGSDIP